MAAAKWRAIRKCSLRSRVQNDFFCVFSASAERKVVQSTSRVLNYSQACSNVNGTPIMHAFSSIIIFLPASVRSHNNHSNFHCCNASSSGSSSGSSGSGSGSGSSGSGNSSSGSSSSSSGIGIGIGGCYDVCISMWAE
jgi:uncharacterized membrane protein YgcG